jgi:ribosomal protein S18 acetylase RimI-like enzyme
MSELNYLPISYLDPSLLQPLMDEEEQAWISDLDWDYSPIRRILVSFIKQKLLPGYAAVDERGAAGYVYFLVNQGKGIIGAIYASKDRRCQEIIDALLSLSISSLKDNEHIKRVEAQIMSFHDVNLTAKFTQQGFSYYPRYYLDLALDEYQSLDPIDHVGKVIPWDSANLSRAAAMTSISYQNQTDAIICEDYRTTAGCENYLRSLVENPGCGIFMPETSFMCMDGHQLPCGFVIGCRISSGVGMIPQIAVHPSYQGRGVGNALMRRCFEQYRALGFHTLSLTVTKKNRRAFEWYQRLGFKIHKGFGAYVWER